MSHQSPITKYFCNVKNMQCSTNENQKSRKRKLSLKKPLNDTIEILSSDDEKMLEIDIKLEESKSSQNSVLSDSSDSSNKTVIYSLSQEINNSIRTSSTPLKSQNNLGTPSTSSRKYYSPNKKRIATKSPKGKGKSIAPVFLHSKKKLFQDECEEYIKACEGQDDKTKFLLSIINEYLKDNALKKLMNQEENNHLQNIFTLPKQSMRLLCRLYWRKNCWYRRGQLNDIFKDSKVEDIKNSQETDNYIEELVNKNYLLTGTHENITIEEYSAILKVDELKEICKSLKLKMLSKKSALQCLQDFCRRPSISSFFTNDTAPDNSKRLLRILHQKAGTCYTLCDIIRNILDRLYVLMYLGMDYSIIREKRLELMLINEKIERETFPIDKNMTIDNAGIVFESKDEFDRYMLAHSLREEYFNCIDTKVKCSLVKDAYESFKAIDGYQFVRYKSLQPWLQKFTPAYIYVKIMESGISELKKGKDETNCRLAVDILNQLLEQTFREHKKAIWYSELALLLQNYLNDAQTAAQILIKCFESNIQDDLKDVVRQRAMKMAQQKNCKIDSEVREALLQYANKENILESSIPSRNCYKQPMENISKGKAMYETKNAQGRLVQGVEEYALSSYFQDGEYTGGGHWEGRIITTMFHLIFWDIIYTKPARAKGVFISYYQRNPLDMFTEDFYLNRKDSIDNRLKDLIASDDFAVEILMREWENRTESEITGIYRDISLETILAVATCLGGSRLAAIFSRLVKNYGYSHSGFPDLTVWNTSGRKIKFVEVKSDNDKPSIKQIQWMQYLIQNNIEAEFCYVGANPTKPKSRRSVKMS